MDPTSLNGHALRGLVGSEAHNWSQVPRAAAQRCSIPPARSGQECLRVLVVDDNHDTADSLAMLVRTWGHMALCAYDAAAALNIAAAALPDVVLLDVAMPVMDGCQVAAQIRAGSGRYDSFLIAVTGYGDELRKNTCHRAGFDLVLIKPVDGAVVEALLLLEAERLGLRPAWPTATERRLSNAEPGSERLLA